MTNASNRPWRTETPSFTIAARRCAVAALLSLATLLAVAAAPAGAATGGASPLANATSDARSGTDFAFSPLRVAGATWYGPGFYGNRTACGQTLRPHTVGVAHRRLPCGTTVRFVHRGRELVTRVIDRGPFTVGNKWDLTNGARISLGFEGTGKIRFALPLRYVKGG